MKFCSMHVKKLTAAVLAAAACMSTGAFAEVRYKGLGAGGYFLHQFPLTNYADYAKQSLGGGLTGEYTFALDRPYDFGLSLRVDGSHVIPKKDTALDKENNIGATGGIWLRAPFRLWNLELAFQPEIAYGVVVRMADGRADGTYVDQQLVVTPGFRFVPFPETLRPLEIEAAPLFSLAFENHRHQLGQAGYRIAAVWHFGMRDTSPKQIVPAAGLQVIGSDLTPDGDNKNETVAFVPTVEKISKNVESWKIDITDPKGNLFRSYTGTGKLPKEVVWDGRSETGEKVYSRNVYTATLTVVPAAKDRERTGCDSVQAAADVMTGILLQEIIPDHEWKMVINTIYFDPDKATFDNLSDVQRKDTIETLDAVVEKIHEHPDAAVVIEGYANNVSNTEAENVNELIPISQARADVILEELAKRGIDRSIMSSAGLGGAKPLAEWNDRANWWKNRRVEFVLKK